MGSLVGDDDPYIGSFLELFNLRFGIEQTSAEHTFGGITEMAALQKEFEIFKVGRPFVESAKLLGLGGLQNNRAKNRWFALLTWLQKIPSDDPGEYGDPRIVKALIANLVPGGAQLPCFMTAHDSRKGLGLKVVVSVGQPIFYIPRDHLTISLPMAPDVPK
ncbi:hypothetical protein [Bradyrhizobium sp. Gha]|uniref:hypothetical protein n=1 Tax=Bradyrhizobium sp. Gha TaxID=1855318 RepID=UPI0008ECEDF4|nr:hypothetical protein [Bradyrhizobium sp. Gha]SFJ60794.1 hypothetical protein SAMN05216525_12990 [Bradyrhizobium sp. Gha]